MMRQRILAMDIFKGNKPYNCSRKYEADYLSVASNPNQKKFVQTCQTLFQKFNDTQVLFADEVTKVNRGGRAEMRDIIVTDQNIYKCDPKSYKIKTFEGTPKSGIPVNDVIGVSMSNQKDNFIVVHTNDKIRDVILQIGNAQHEKLSEFVSILAGLYTKTTNKKLPVQFYKDSFEYDNSSKLGKKQTIVFIGDPAVLAGTAVWKKTKLGGEVRYN